MAKIIGITGNAGAGKDTLALLLCTANSLIDVHTSIRSFADPLKEYVMAKFDLGHSDVYTQEGKSKVIEWLGVTVREVLQREGTELTRDPWGQDFWILHMQNKIKKLADNAVVIIPDVRFEDEAKFVKDAGGVLIQIQRQGLEVDTGHRSEQGIGSVVPDFVVHNNGSISDLGEEADRVAGRIMEVFSGV